MYCTHDYNQCGCYDADAPPSRPEYEKIKISEATCLGDFHEAVLSSGTRVEFGFTSVQTAENVWERKIVLFTVVGVGWRLIWSRFRNMNTLTAADIERIENDVRRAFDLHLNRKLKEAECS